MALTFHRNLPTYQFTDLLNIDINHIVVVY